MGKLTLELTVARQLYERRLRTMRRVKHHVSSLPATAEGRARSEVALRIAKAELKSAKEQLDRIFSKVRQRKSEEVSVAPVDQMATPHAVNDRDFFSEALNRTDPTRRLQLSK
jgi:hypothetical protein